MAAVQNRSDIEDPVIRRPIRIALDTVTSGDGRDVVCSELVYRSLRESKMTPEGRLRPVILEPQPDHTPMPDVDVGAVIEKIKDLLFPKTQQKLLHAQDEEQAQVLAEEDAPKELEQALLRAGARLGLSGTSAGLLKHAAAPPAEIPWPVARLVRPRDLEVSPSVQFLARLK